MSSVQRLLNAWGRPQKSWTLHSVLTAWAWESTMKMSTFPSSKSACVSYPRAFYFPEVTCTARQLMYVHAFVTTGITSLEQNSTGWFRTIILHEGLDPTVASADTQFWFPRVEERQWNAKLGAGNCNCWQIMWACCLPALRHKLWGQLQGWL